MSKKARTVLAFILAFLILGCVILISVCLAAPISVWSKISFLTLLGITTIILSFLLGCLEAPRTSGSGIKAFFIAVWRWIRRHWLYLGWMLFILALIALLLSLLIPWPKSEKIVQVPGPTETIDNPALQAENERLQQEISRLNKTNYDMEINVVGLYTEIESLKAQLVGSTVISIPAVPSSSELVSWTDVEAKTLMRAIYPGNDKYRDPVFLSGQVYPLSWYQDIMLYMPEEVFADEWPAKFISWFDTRYDNIITGYAWTCSSTGDWQTVKIVPAHENRTISLYYVVGRNLIRAGGRGDTITPTVRAVNLLK